MSSELLAIIIAAIIEPTNDSKISAPIPATSPTLSPTLSAITPGFRGSSSGIPASTLPTKSAPTSAALVYIPPPTRAKRAIDDAPIPKPAAADKSLASFSAPRKKATREIPSNPSPPTESPITAPPLYETANAPACPSFLAAIAVLPLADVAARIPESPASPDAIAPAKNAIAVSKSLSHANNAPTTNTNTLRTLYSAFMKAIAPS